MKIVKTVNLTAFVSLVTCLCLLSMPLIAQGLTISNAMTGTLNWYGGDGVGLLFLAEILDGNGDVSSDASVWVIAPNGQKYTLEYNPGLKTYAQGGEATAVSGDYIFHAELNGDAAQPVKKTLNSIKSLNQPERIILNPKTPTTEKPLFVHWNRIKGAAGYFVALTNDTNGELVWSNTGSLWDNLRPMTSYLIPSGVMAQSTKHSLLMLASNNNLIKNASAVSGFSLEFTPGQPFNMATVCCTTSSNNGGKWIELQVFLEDFFGNNIENAQVKAIYPSGREVPFIQNINGWYEPSPSDRPDPNDNQSFGTYNFIATLNGKLFTHQYRDLPNYFLPVPTNVEVTPWPLERAEAFNVTWNPVPGATSYKIDVDEKNSGKIIYISSKSDTPSHNAPPEIWDSLTAGNAYVILTQSMDKEDYQEASATSFYVVEFTAP